MEYKTVVDQIIIIISNVKLQIIFPKTFSWISWIRIMLFLLHLQRTQCFFNGDVFSQHGKLFSKWWYQDRFDKITVQADTFPELRHKNRN